MSPFGDNQDYIEKLQQDIRDLRNEYAEKSRQSPNLSNYRNQFNFDTSKLRSSSQKDEDRREYFTPPSQEIENLVQRSFWDDLAKMKQKIVKKKQVLNWNQCMYCTEYFDCRSAVQNPRNQKSVIPGMFGTEQAEDTVTQG